MRNELAELPLLAFMVGALAGILACGAFVGGIARAGSLEDFLRKNRRWLLGLGIAVGMIVAVLSAIALVWGPLAVPPSWVYYAYWGLIRVPFAQLMLGLVFGVIAAAWIRYIIVPVELRTEALQIAHRRWGFILIAVLALGVLYPPLSRLNFSGANVNTPLGGISLTAERSAATSPRPTASGTEASNQIARTHDPPFDLGYLVDYVNRDIAYSRAFLASGSQLRDGLQALHGEDAEFIESVVTPVSKCIAEHYEIFHSLPRLHDHLVKALGSYEAAIRAVDLEVSTEQEYDEVRRYTVSQLYSDIYDAVVGLDSELVQLRSSRECVKARSKMATKTLPVNGVYPKQPPLNGALPYAAIGLAQFLSSTGADEVAARVLARWLRVHASESADSQIAACNRARKPNCVAIGVMLPSGKRQALPAWYRVRAQFELGLIVQNTEANWTIVRALEANIKTFENLFPDTPIRSVDQWMKECVGKSRRIDVTPTVDQIDTTLLKSPLLGADEERLFAQLILSYVTQVNRLVYFYAKLTVPSRGTDILVPQNLIDKAKRNTALDMSCFPSELVGGAPDAYLGDFDVQYGVLLMHSVLTEEANSDQDVAGRRNILREAQQALERGIALLKSHLDRDNGRISQLPLEERLFAEGAFEETYQLGQRTLRDVNKTLKEP